MIEEDSGVRVVQRWCESPNHVRRNIASDEPRQFSLLESRVGLGTRSSKLSRRDDSLLPPKALSLI
jgi:hypothetical protein